jgi:WYL domain-containing protein
MENFVILIIVVAAFYYFFKPKTKPTKRDSPEKAKTNSWKDDLEVLWDGPPRTIEFDYFSNKEEKTRRKVSVRKVTRNDYGKIYLHGRCHTRNDDRTFKVARIISKIENSGIQFEKEAWVENLIG